VVAVAVMVAVEVSAEAVVAVMEAVAEAVEADAVAVMEAAAEVEAVVVVTEVAAAEAVMEVAVAAVWLEVPRSQSSRIVTPESLSRAARKMLSLHSTRLLVTPFTARSVSPSRSLLLLEKRHRKRSNTVSGIPSDPSVSNLLKLIVECFGDEHDGVMLTFHSEQRFIIICLFRMSFTIASVFI
jgi:hypothetical protein